ncbi:hypothetical protein NE237_030788 [Protea cynaroides]|uniref:Transposase MuDR plant domain-containing protein n=1 Tax=Protea cynaroides TaxID=273540 RepID=A0A9Q0JW46_9MAGN|nr:hypothetical protein NE237_030788 [Protea cynaroides]
MWKLVLANDDAEWTDSGELVSEDTSSEEDSKEANFEQGKAAGNDEEEIDWSSDEFEGLEFDDGGEVERKEGWMLRKGNVYRNIHLFRAALANYVVHQGIDIFKMKNERKRVTVICAAIGCP